MIINCSCLAGKNLRYLEEAHIETEGSRIKGVFEGYAASAMDLKDYLAMPGLINAHTHIGDAFAKEAAIGRGVHEAVGRKGVKWDLYKEVGKETLLCAMKDTAEYMLESGTTCFADFRENGEKGLKDLEDALGDLPIKKVALGRDLKQEEFESCDGLGLNIHQLNQIPKDPKARGKKLIALHAGETEGEVALALKADPDIIVHYTRCTMEDIKEAAKKGISIIVCPRSNAALGAGFPPVRELLDEGVNVALGTDNVMINSPDMWREMEFLIKRSGPKKAIKPHEALRMCTINAAKALKKDTGAIEENRKADVIFIDKNAANLGYTRNLTATIACRCENWNVRKIMIDGAFKSDKNLNKKVY
ncbi:MAG: amidohydrolase family protein [Candidatus Altiarchaeota archaeon]|nr:amidohydrolase family protein [Candidatus Altiarchaeota archaeon]